VADVLVERQTLSLRAEQLRSLAIHLPQHQPEVGS
jgi:hypothetical protein